MTNSNLKISEEYSSSTTSLRLDHAFRSGRPSKSSDPDGIIVFDTTSPTGTNASKTGPQPINAITIEDAIDWSSNEKNQVKDHETTYNSNPPLNHHYWTFTSDETEPEQYQMTISRKSSKKKRTLVVYSGPTSLDRSIGKNDIYLKNFDYFLHHGIECGSDNGLGNQNSEMKRINNNLQYAIVLTQEVADRYTAPDGLITRKQHYCNSVSFHHSNDNAEPLISVLIREDKCYDMESILVVVRAIDVVHLYDHFVYINCGLAGPRLGSGSLVPSKMMKNLSSWTDLYTSLLSEKVQMVGHTINTHFSKTYSPHIQSFLYAVNTPMINIWLRSGALYDCGISNDDFKDDVLRMALVWRYEVGITRVLLEKGYSVAAAFMHQGGKIGEPLIVDANSTYGRNFNEDEISKSDIFREDGLRFLTESSFPERDDRQKYSILPWASYVFFKVSRLVPQEIQQQMHYKNLGPVELVPNDARFSSLRHWRRKAGVPWWEETWYWLGTPHKKSSSKNNNLCRGRHCKFEHVATETGEIVGVIMMITLFLWYFATLKFVERKVNVYRLNELRRKWK